MSEELEHGAVGDDGQQQDPTPVKVNPFRPRNEEPPVEPDAPQGEPQEVKPTEPKGLDPAVQAAIEATARALRPEAPAKAEPSKELSEEEWRKAIHYYEANPEELEEVFGAEFTPEQAQAFTGILQRVAKQAATMASLYARHETNQLQQTISPMLQERQQHAIEQQEHYFFERHKDLKAYDPLVKALGNQMMQEVQSGTLPPFETLEKAADAVALKVREVLKTIPGAAQGGQQQQQPVKGKMASVTVTKGQAASGQKTPTGHPTARAIFGRD